MRGRPLLVLLGVPCVLGLGGCVYVFGSPPTRLPPLRGELVHACVWCVCIVNWAGFRGMGREMPHFSTETSGSLF